MRKLQFKIYDPNENKIIINDICSYMHFEDNGTVNCFGFPKEYIPLQLTEFPDKKGDFICEDDIVKVDNDPYVITRCIFEKGVPDLIDNAGGYWTRQLYHQPERLKIIGNFNKNPELFK